jgi:energy-coupling factor transport system ATP-binding protein
MTDGAASRDDLAAELTDVVFSYDRDAELPSGPDYGGAVDPDTRGGLVLRGVDLEIPRGSFTVVMGASGGGKSTLVRTLNAIIPSFIRGRFRGDVAVLGRDATSARVSTMAEAVGLVMQDYEAQLFGTSLDAEVGFGPENLAVPPEAIRPRVEAALETAGLETLDRRREPGTLSGGQKQRLVLAGVLAMHPEFLVLDEPTSDLDPAGSRDVIDIVAHLSDGAGESAAPADGEWTGPETIVMVTHTVEEALLADRAVLLRGGEVYRVGAVREVFTDFDALEACRVAVPPLVAAFDRLGVDRGELPLVPDEAVELADSVGLDWTPPARRGGHRPGVPARTGESLGDPLFELAGVVHWYSTDRGEVRAVDDVSLTVRDREVLAIVGQNGSGKTTLAKHLNGLLEPDEGSVTFRGTAVPSIPMEELGRDVGFLFQNPDHQLFASTVREEVEFGPENFGLEGEELDTRVDRAIAAVELEPLEEADPFNLSKGQRQRVALASVLATDPDVIVFDEPTTGLDAAQQERFMDLVADLNREEGLTVVMVTHDMSTVARYARRAVVLREGRIELDAPTRELFADDRLADWSLAPPHPVAVSNALADSDDALPALLTDELVAGLGGEDALGGGG